MVPVSLCVLASRSVCTRSAQCTLPNSGVTVREPLDKLDPDHGDLDTWEIIMYVLTLAFSFEGEASQRTSSLLVTAHTFS